MKLCVSCSDIVHYVGGRLLLHIPRLSLYEGDRVGLVGANGAGKSTLLRILAGDMACDEGSVRTMTSACLIRQWGDAEGDIADGEIGSRFAADVPDRARSGGEKTRRRIASALSRRPGLLLADEPTTDLDEDGITELTSQLSAYPGALVLVSHDSDLLDTLVTKIWHLENGTVTEYPDNYSDFRRELENQRAFRQFEYDQYRGEQDRLRKAIRNKREQASGMKLPSRMGNSEARLHTRGVSASQASVSRSRKALESRLSHLEEKERPQTDPDIRMALSACEGVTSRVALEIRRLDLAFPGKPLLTDASMSVPTGSKTALLGPNGCGKSTLLRRILEDGGGVLRKPGVKIAFLGQDMNVWLDLSRTALENAMADSDRPQSAVRTVLSRLGLFGDDVFKPASVLSGGERVKVALCRLLVSRANFLILDEPTNHLDVFTVDALIEVLSAYPGTLLFVSHDRRLVREVADRIVYFENGTLRTDETPRRPKNASRPADAERMRIEMRMAEIASDESRREEYQALARRKRELDP